MGGGGGGGRTRTKPVRRGRNQDICTRLGSVEREDEKLGTVEEEVELDARTNRFESIGK